MKVRLLLALLPLLIASCQNNTEAEIYGIWTNTGEISDKGDDVQGEMIFTEDGRYIVNLIYHGDSAVERINGKYQLDTATNTLTITAFGKTHQQEVIEVSKESLKLKSTKGTVLEYRRK